MKASARGRHRNIRWQPDEDWYKELQLSDMAHDLMVYLGKLRPVVSSRCYGGVVVLSRTRAKRRLTETRSFLSYVITGPVCNDIYLATVFNGNISVTVTERGANGTAVYDHVIEDKGRKIKAIFNILDGPRREQVFPAEPEPQLESLPERHPEIQTELGPECEEQSKSQSEPYFETQTEIVDALQPKLQSEPQPDPLPGQVKHAAEEAVKIKSIRDRLGASVTYLEGLLKVGDVMKDVSRSFQSVQLIDYKYSHRSILSLAFPLEF